MLLWLIGFRRAVGGRGVAFAVGLSILVSTAIAKRRSKRDYDLDLARISAENEQALYTRETNRMVEKAKTEQNLITSHRASD